MAESQIFEQARRRREKIGAFCCFLLGQNAPKARIFLDLLEKNQNQNAVLEHKNTVLFAAGGGEKIGFGRS